MITYINPDAIEDQSIDWSKLKNIPEFPLMIKITYAELKDLRDNAELVPGQQYRITDYVTTVSQTNTKSASHPFDIIVTADDESTLNEKARAIQHEGDTYFANQNLSAWELWYCLDNDTERFAWANSSEDDVESILQIIKPASGVSAAGTYTYDTPISRVVYNNVSYTLEIGVRTMINSGPPVHITKTDEFTLVVEEVGAGYIAAGLGISIYGIVYAGRGIIYRMIDENYNDCPYDFKNIMFRHPKLTILYPDWYYTFTYLNNGVVSDHSLNGDYCRNNTIKEYYENSEGIIKAILNNIVFINITTLISNCNNNSFGNNCYDNSFGNNCNNNFFGNNCYDNSFGNGCYDNSFGNGCYDNSFGNGCYDNSFGNNCYSNSFGNNYSENSFGNGCYSNSFGNDYFCNSFGSGCYRNDFGNSYNENSFGSGYSGNFFGDNINNRAHFSGKLYASGGFYEE